MLEFYPMPTNLSGGLYPHQQNHGGARFLDSPSPAQPGGLGNNNNSLNNIDNINNNNNNININNSSNVINVNNNSAINATASGLPSMAGIANNFHHHHQHPHHPQQHHQHSQQQHHQSHQQQQQHHPHQLQLQQQQQQQQQHQHHQLTAASASASSPASGSAPGSGCGSASASASASCSLGSPSSTAASSATVAGVVVGLGAAPSPGTPGADSPPTSAMSTAPATTTVAAAAASAAATSTKLSADCSGRTEVGHIKCEKNYEICEGCGQKIHDRFLMKVGDSNWHEQCLACCYCGIQLSHTCYVRNSKLYCKIDYDRIFAVKCAACCHPILPQELVMRPNPNYTFHLPCFVCYACRLPLQKGEQFMLRDGQLLCYRHDLEKEMYLAAAAVHHCHPGLAALAGDDDDLMRPRDGRRGPKRPRTILTSQQRKQFKASFDQSPKPCRKVREALAKDTGLSVRVVQVWFQNQRAKMKKIQRKAKNGAGGGGGGGAGGGSGQPDDKDKEKDEKGVKQESGSGSENGYLGLDAGFASQPLNPNLPFSPDDYPANSNDSFCSSDLSLDGSNFDQLDDDTDSLSLNNLDLQSTCSSSNQHSHSHGSSAHDILASLNTNLINPINKLYQMQNSYFSSEP